MWQVRLWCIRVILDHSDGAQQMAEVVVAFGAMAFAWENLEGMPVLARPSVADLIDRKRFKGVFGGLAGATDYWGVLLISLPWKMGDLIEVSEKALSRPVGQRRWTSLS